MRNNYRGDKSSASKWQDRCKSSLIICARTLSHTLLRARAYLHQGKVCDPTCRGWQRLDANVEPTGNEHDHGDGVCQDRRDLRRGRNRTVCMCVCFVYVVCVLRVSFVCVLCVCAIQAMFLSLPLPNPPPPLQFYTYKTYLIAMPNATAAMDSKVMMPIKTKNRPTSGRRFASQ